MIIIVNLIFSFEMIQKGFPLIKVRRKLYKPNTTAGKGVKWEWLSLITSEWNLYNMDVQNIIEDAWSKVYLLFLFCFLTYFFSKIMRLNFMLTGCAKL